jgi:NADH:ubiquinone oxidoreductase subunit B-like Fe-S oxidoreductase
MKKVRKMDKKPEVVFMPGCFDGFEGTQEELDELMAEIHRMAESGELFEQAVPLEDADFDEEELSMIENAGKRNLQ